MALHGYMYQLEFLSRGKGGGSAIIAELSGGEDYNKSLSIFISKEY